MNKPAKTFGAELSIQRREVTDAVHVKQYPRKIYSGLRRIEPAQASKKACLYAVRRCGEEAL